MTILATMIQRCQAHKKRNSLSYLLESAKASVSIALTMAYRKFDYETSKSKLIDIDSDLEHNYPKVAASLLEGLEETLTAHRQKCPGYCTKLCVIQIQWNPCYELVLSGYEYWEYME